jgi:hypothetical protein
MQSHTYLPDLQLGRAGEEDAEPATLDLRAEGAARPHVAATRRETVYAIVYSFLTLAGAAFLAAVAFMAAG